MATRGAVQRPTALRWFFYFSDQRFSNTFTKIQKQVEKKGNGRKAPHWKDL
jgi:hypothetical protein